MPRPMATISGACVKSTADFASLKRSRGLVRICAALNDTPLNLLRFSRGCAASKSARNAPTETMRTTGCTSERDVRGGFSLEHLPHEHEFAAVIAIADAIPDHALTSMAASFGAKSRTW